MNSPKHENTTNNFPNNLSALESLLNLVKELKTSQLPQKSKDEKDIIKRKLKNLNNSKDNYEKFWNIPDINTDNSKSASLKSLNEELKLLDREKLDLPYTEYYDFAKDSFFNEMTRIKEYKTNKEENAHNPDIKNKLVSNLIAINALCEIATDISQSPSPEEENSFEYTKQKIELLEKAKIIYKENCEITDDENDLLKVRNLDIADTLFRKIYPTTVKSRFREYYDFLKDALAEEKERIKVLRLNK